MDTEESTGIENTARIRDHDTKTYKEQQDNLIHSAGAQGVVVRSLVLHTCAGMGKIKAEHRNE